MRSFARVLPFLVVLASILSPAIARAYPGMIRHGYGGCMPCHADPSGSGALTSYGRAQGDLFLRSRSSKTDEVSPSADFLWGGIALPEEVRLGGDLRGGFLAMKNEGAPVDSRSLWMRSDLYGDVNIGRLRLAGSFGFLPTGGRGAAITRSPGDNLVSRDHWIGFDLQEEGAMLIRAGRIARPFGLRMIEHTLWVRNSTRTDIDDDQQHGVAFAISKDHFRAEVMAILGNFQVRNDDYRERGYSAYLEFLPASRLALGASSQFTRARRDIGYLVTDYRHVNGVFMRYAPAKPLVFLLEFDAIYQSLTWNGHRGGYAGMVQADWEPIQGMHFLATGEMKNGGSKGEPPSYGAWASAVWFFAPHADIRLDNMYRRLGSAAGDADSLTLLLQLHLYL